MAAQLQKASFRSPKFKMLWPLLAQRMRFHLRAPQRGQDRFCAGIVDFTKGLHELAQLPFGKTFLFEPHQILRRQLIERQTLGRILLWAVFAKGHVHGGKRLHGFREVLLPVLPIEFVHVIRV